VNGVPILPLGSPRSLRQLVRLGLELVESLAVLVGGLIAAGITFGEDPPGVVEGVWFVGVSLAGDEPHHECNDSDHGDPQQRNQGTSLPATVGAPDRTYAATGPGEHGQKQGDHRCCLAGSCLMVTMMQGEYWVVVTWGKASALHPCRYVASSDSVGATEQRGS
jgi:hypothetical protein